jgi:hypothetical protein
LHLCDRAATVHFQLNSEYGGKEFSAQKTCF